MQRFRQYGQKDDVPEIFGDIGWLRLDMRSDPVTLAAGVAQVMENVRFDTNGLTPRGGMSRQFEAGVSIGTIFYTGIYRPLGEEDQLAFLTANALWLFDPDTRSLTLYSFPSGQIIDGGDAVDFQQTGIGDDSFLAQAFIFRGFDKPVLAFDGTAVTVDNDVPPAGFALAYQNRLTVNASLQELSISDYLEFSAGHWSILNQFQIEYGGPDYLVGLLAYQGDYVLIGSRKKIFVGYFDPNLGTEQAYTGSLSDASFLRLQTNEAGLVGREAFLESAGMVWFVSDNGVYAFQPNLNNELVTLGRPLSADIQPIWDRFSAGFAGGASIQRYGYRLYFALPISDEPVAIVNLSVVNQMTTGVTLPFTLPALLSEGGLCTVTTETPHGLNSGDMVNIANVAAGGVNGQQTVRAVLDSYNYTFAVPANSPIVLGTRATSQKLATRNNAVAVFNLRAGTSDSPLGVWESIDWMPDGIYADWLRIADYGAQRRLWVIDAVNGPALYEDGTVDEIGNVIGGVKLPFTLPATLSAANYASVPVAARLITRTLRWVGIANLYPGMHLQNGFAYPRKLRAVELRATMNPGDSITMTTRMRNPPKPEADSAVSFTATAVTDEPLSQRLYTRALEADVEIQVTAGQPTLRGVEVQVMRSGEY